MISNTLVICIGLASAAIIIALLMRKSRRRLPATSSAEISNWRDMSFAGMLLSVAAAIGLARAEAGQSGDGNPDSGHSWHGSHLDHSSHGGHSHDGGGFQRRRWRRRRDLERPKHGHKTWLALLNLAKADDVHPGDFRDHIVAGIAGEAVITPRNGLFRLVPDCSGLNHASLELLEIDRYHFATGPTLHYRHQCITR